MAQNITSFYRTAQQRDFARQFQFRLVQFGTTAFNEDDLVYVETATLPGRTINNVQVPYMGLQFNVPGTASYPGSNAYNITFRCDQSYNIRAVLEQSTLNTFNDDTSTGQYNTPNDSSVLVMHLTDKRNVAIREYVLYGVYIQALQDATYDIKDTGTVQTVQATLAYQFWRSNRLNRASIPERFRF